jgi:hypothetical protein
MLTDTLLLGGGAALDSSLSSSPNGLLQSSVRLPLVADDFLGLIDTPLSLDVSGRYFPRSSFDADFDGPASDILHAL